MARKSSRAKAEEASITPLVTNTETRLQWDSRSGAYRNVEAQTDAAQRQPSFFQAIGPPATEPGANPYWTTSEIGLVPGCSPQTLAWEQAATLATFSLAPLVLADTIHAILVGASGELVWVPGPEQEEVPLPAVYPMLRIHTLHEVLQVERLTIVPTLTAPDPLLHHIAQVLRVTIEEESVAGQLYAQSLADALVVHFLRRSRVLPSPLPQMNGGLSPYKLRNTTVYIKAHLEQELSLVQLAAVGETSPAHFARLFKHATGLAPHQYVIACRMEHAKRLLAETDLPLTEIAFQIGCTDHSHFGALFRAHLATTPKAFRDQARK